MRKKVTLVTCAAGEIGPGSHPEPGAGQPNLVLSLDLQALPAAISGAATYIQGDILDRSLRSRLVSEYEIDGSITWPRCSPRAASTPRKQLTGSTSREPWGCCSSQPSNPSGAASRSSSSSPARSPSTACPTWRRRRLPPRPRVGVELPPHDVRLQQALLRAPRQLLQPALPATGRRPPVKLDFRCVRFPGLISADDDPQRRDERLRSRDAACRCPGRALMPASSGRT